MNGVMDMNKYNQCPYCEKIVDVSVMGLDFMEVDRITDTMCPLCNKAFFCECCNSVEFRTWSVEDELDAVATLFLFNRKVDRGDLTEKEIEEFREELKYFKWED